MKSHYITAVLLGTFVTNVLSVQIVPVRAASWFPECGLTCSNLQQAQQACGGQPSNPTAENCFCQYPSVQLIYAASDTTCYSECSSNGDRQQIRNWFTNFCQQVSQGIDPIAPTATTDTGATPTPTASPVYDPSDAVISHTQTGSAWFSHHWQWIVMVIVLLVGLLTLGFFAKWLRERHQRKAFEKSRSTSNNASTRLSKLLMSPSEKANHKTAGDSPGGWGPHQHTAITPGYQYDMEQGVYYSGGARGDNVDQAGKQQSKHDRSSKVEVTEITGETGANEPARQREASRPRQVERRGNPDDEIGHAS